MGHGFVGMSNWCLDEAPRVSFALQVHWSRELTFYEKVVLEADPRNKSFGQFRISLIWPSCGGTVQLNDVLGDTLQSYTLLKAGYGLLDEPMFVGVETENHINMAVRGPDGEGLAETIHDFSVGPQLALPFKGIMNNPSVQFHPKETIRNQFWLRMMVDFGPAAD
jgi:hypothetical protein